MDHQLAKRAQSLDALEKLLQANSFERVLERGFALVTDGSGTPVKRGAEAAEGAMVTVRFADASRQALLDPRGTESTPRKSLPIRTKNPARKSKVDDSQDRLF